VKLRYLLDTDWAVWWLRGRSEVVTRLTAWERDGLGISIVTLAELYEGVERGQHPDVTRPALERDFLEMVILIPFSRQAAARFGRESARLRRLGQPLPDFDLVVAATALEHGLTLLTEDRHFERIPGLRIRRVDETSP
jgi:predicted nucleic acid-binding protein